MTFSELKKKDIICIGDGRLIGRASDLMMDPNSGQILALIVNEGGGFCGMFRTEKNQLEIPWRQIAWHRGRCDSCFGERMRIK